MDASHEPQDIGDLSDEYTLLGELGRGGNAIVYKARDRALFRDVAIKVVRPRFAATADEAIARLEREARTVARLQHPNIVTVHAVKRLPDGGLALVMQLVPGRTLTQAIRDDGPFDAERAERVLHDVAEALAFAHAHGVIHRDVKPENVFIDLQSGRALLSDFGIAYSSEFDSRLTMTGSAIGTPAYMAPEQIDGAPANARSDLYSLGVVAYELLTGAGPYAVQSGRRAELQSAIERGELRPTSEAATDARARRALRGELGAVLAMALARRPDQRYADVETLARELGRVLQGRPVLAPPRAAPAAPPAAAAAPGPPRRPAGAAGSPRRARCPPPPRPFPASSPPPGTVWPRPAARRVRWSIV
jgi:serine/threonine protein kinase